MLLVLPLKKLVTRTERWLSGKEDLGLVPITHMAPHTSNSDPGYPTPLLTSSSIRHACSCMTFKRNIHKPKKIQHPISKFPQIQKGAQIIEAQLDAISQMLSFIYSPPPTRGIMRSVSWWLSTQPGMALRTRLVVTGLCFFFVLWNWALSLGSHVKYL